MQSIINKILSGELSQKDLISELVTFNDDTLNEYDAACDVVENNQKAITKLEADARQREGNIKTIEKNALLAVDYARTLESDNTILKQNNKEAKALKAENKKLKAQTKRQAESNKKATARGESLTKQFVSLNKEISVLKSDRARLRLTGHKEIGKYAFSVFPTKVHPGVSDERKIVLLAHDTKGCFKSVTCENGEIHQARSHAFKFNKEQKDFIEGFDAVAKADKYQFTDRVLSLVN
jgi:hypothetical protein